MDGVHEIDAAAGAWLTGYSYRKAITVTPVGTSALVDFPVGIMIASDAQLATHARADGTDLVITASDATTVLDRELVHFGPAGAAELWTRVPSLGPASTTLYLYYGGAAASNRTSVWSPPFAGVWHLSDQGASTRDSTSHAHDLAATSASEVPTSAIGIAGAARVYDGVDDGLSIPDPSDGSLDFGTSSFSFSVWLDVTTSAGAFDTPLWKGGTSSTEPGYCLLTGTGAWNAKVEDNVTYDDPSPGSESTLANAWVHIAAVVDRGAQTFTVYTNGTKADQQSIGGLGTLSNSLAFELGRTESPYKGALDEARVYSTALTADWIANEHANLVTASYVVFGAEQSH